MKYLAYYFILSFFLIGCDKAPDCDASIIIKNKVNEFYAYGVYEVRTRDLIVEGVLYPGGLYPDSLFAGWGLGSTFYNQPEQLQQTIEVNSNNDYLVHIYQNHNDGTRTTYVDYENYSIGCGATRIDIRDDGIPSVNVVGELCKTSYNGTDDNCILARSFACRGISTLNTNYVRACIRYNDSNPPGGDPCPYCP